MILIDVCSEGCDIFTNTVSPYIRKGEPWFQMPHLTEEANRVAERLREVKGVTEIKLPVTARAEIAKQVSCMCWLDVSAEWLWTVFHGSPCLSPFPYHCTLMSQTKLKITFPDCLVPGFLLGFKLANTQQEGASWCRVFKLPPCSSSLESFVLCFRACFSHHG